MNEAASCESNWPAFEKGLDLCEGFWNEAVHPILQSRFPSLRYSAARLGCGSEVLGFDTPQSRDHDWGPRLRLFLSEGDYAAYRQRIHDALADELPVAIHGYPTNFGGSLSEASTMVAVAHGPVNHGVAVTTPAQFFREYVGFDPAEPISALDWLAAPSQRLRGATAGRVFHDGLDVLVRARERLSWYPRDIWLYLLSNQWVRIDQEAPFVARCGDVGDELGSRVVAYRLVNEAMKLCFLMERQYAPYYKWFGTAFSRLKCAPTLSPTLRKVLSDVDWRERERYLSQLYVELGVMQNQLLLARDVVPSVVRFWGRPYMVPPAAGFADALWDAIESPSVCALPTRIGAVGQFVDSTDVLDSIERCKSLTAVYDTGETCEEESQ